MAIAYQGGIFSTTQAASPYTQTLTVTGSDRCLIVNVGFDGASQTITGVTFDGVAMTAMPNTDSTGDSAADYDHQLWYLLNPSLTASANLTVTWTGGGNTWFHAANYTGVGGVDQGTHGGVAGTPLTLTLNSVPAQSWTILTCSDGGAFPTASTGTTARSGGATWLFGDSNGIVSGSVSMSGAWTGGSGGGGNMMSITPKAVSTATQCIAFNGSSQRAAATDSASLSPTGDQTHEGWVKWTTLPTAGNSACVFAKWTSTGNQKSIAVNLVNTAGVYSFEGRVSTDGAAVALSSTNLLQTPVVDTWYHYRFVYIAASSKITFYVNGMNPLDITGLAGSVFNSTADYTLGWGFDFAYAAAKFANWRVWDAQHTTEDIMVNHGTTATNLKAEWALNGAATDTSGNSNTLTYTGSPSYSTDTPFPYQQVSAGVLEGNLVSYWGFNESSGNAADSKGSNTLTNNNSTAYATGKQGNGADFEASSSNNFSITDASQSGLDTMSDLTVAFWLKRESTGSQAIFGQIDGNAGASGRAWAIYVEANTASSFDLLISDGTTATWKYVEPSWSTATWYHCAVVHDHSAGNAKFYINGVQFGSTQTGLPTAAINTSSTIDWMAGAAFNTSPSKSNYLDGLLDELGVWKETLSPEAINALYNGGTGIPYTYSAGGGSAAPTRMLMGMGT